MAVSEVSICSNALLMLGAQPINDFNESNDRARLAANLYAGARDSLLREHPWNCAVKRILLAPDVETPVFGYPYSFTLPADYIRALTVNEGYRKDYLIEGRQILTHANSVKLKYVFQNTDVNTYDSSLINLLEMLMAAKMAYAITQSTSMSQFRLEEYQMALRVAKAQNGLEYPPETLGESLLLEQRLYHG